ncbi:Rv0361 family membrane protein [Micromonospora chersina]
MQPPAGSQVSRVPAQRTPPEQLAPPAPAPAPARPKRRLRTVLAVVAGVLALLCAGGGVVGFVLYDRATAPDRSAPDVVVVNYLQAVLVTRDDNRAALFTCDGSLQVMDDYRDQIVSREQELKVAFSINIENVVASKPDSSSAVVTAVIRRSAMVDGVQQSLTDPWRFELRDQNGWRVCSAQPM